jgi:hypothetical protein
MIEVYIARTGGVNQVFLKSGLVAGVGKTEDIAVYGETWSLTVNANYVILL